MTVSNDLRARLDTAVRRREELAQKRQRLLGRLEEAERNLDELKAKCRSKNIDPDNLDALIARLRTTLEQSVTDLEAKITEAEQALELFTNRK
jgi:chromosome segregation ATPase